MGEKVILGEDIIPIQRRVKIGKFPAIAGFGGAWITF